MSARCFLLASIGAGLFLTMIVLPLSGFGQKWGEIESQEWSLQPPQKYPEAAAAIIFDHGLADVSAYEGLTLERHIRIKIFNKNRAEKVLTVEIELEEEDDFSGFRAQTFTPDGKLIKVADKYEKKVGEARIITFTFPAVVDGSIIEYRYKLFNPRLWMLAPWFFQNEIYTCESQYTISLHQGFTYSIACSNIPFDKKDPVREDDRRFGEEYSYFTWKLEDLLPIEQEPHSSAWLNAFSALYIQLISYEDPDNSVSLISEWGDLGELLQGSFDEYAGKADIIRKTALAISSPAASNEEKIRALYNYVRDSLILIEDEYDYLPFGEARTVLKEGKGSPAQKNALLTALLAGLDYEAGNVLIGTRDHVQFNPDLKQLIQFNHLVSMVRLTDKTYVLDASSRSTAFPFLPPPDLIFNGLLINGAESKILKIDPVFRPSGRTFLTRLALDSEGGAVCSTNVGVKGHCLYDFEDYLGDSLTESKIVDYLLEEIDLDYELVAQAVKFDSGADSLQISYIIHIPEYASFLGDKMIIPLSSFALLENPFKSERRTLPIDFMYANEITGELEITLPENMIAVELPGHIDEAIDGIRFYRGAMADSSAVRVKSRFVLEKPFFRPTEYQDLRRIFDSMEQSALDQIVLESGAEGTN